MLEWLMDGVTRVLRVPAEPEPPPGDPATIQVFRAAPDYLRLRLIKWALKQATTLIGLVVGLFVIDLFPWAGEAPLSTLFVGVEVFAWTAFIVQIPLSFAALRLDYELRWYMLSDRALRIREGVLSVRERTMTFANIQQIAVRQGPLQRVLGLADLEVRTAGGGGSDGEGDGTGDLHRGYLRGVERVEWVRDTLRARVHRYRDSGLGDPGEIPPPHRPEAAGRPSLHGGAVAAATELLNEVRALRVETERRAATAGSVADPSGRRGDPEDPP